jgi:hypothetical protein
MKCLYVLLILMGTDIVHAMEPSESLEGFKLSIEKAVQDGDFIQLSKLVEQKPLWDQLSKPQLENWVSLSKKLDNLYESEVKLCKSHMYDNKSCAKMVNATLQTLGFCVWTTGIYTSGKPTPTESYNWISPWCLVFSGLIWVAKKNIDSYNSKRLLTIVNNDLKSLLEKQTNAGKIKTFFEIYCSQKEQLTSQIVTIPSTETTPLISKKI